jgi:hypothetical protein
MQGVCPVGNNIILFHKASEVLQWGFNLKEQISLKDSLGKQVGWFIIQLFILMQQLLKTIYCWIEHSRTVNDKLGQVWRKSSMAYSKELSNMPGGTMQNHKKLQSGQQVPSWYLNQASPEQSQTCYCCTNLPRKMEIMEDICTMNCGTFFFLTSLLLSASNYQWAGPLANPF